MNYRFEQVVLASDRILHKSPKPVISSKYSTAIVLHLFYSDLWKEINHYLSALSIPYDLYITVPPHTETSVLKHIVTDQPNANIYIVENRGRDVLPFFLVMNHIGTSTYRYICKLHSKKTGASPLGNVWRKLLYFDLIGSDSTVNEIIKMFDNDPDIGMITGKNTILDSERYDYGNTAKIDKLINMSGFLFQDEYLFAGGTMFWVRSELLEPVLKLFREGRLEFEEEKGHKKIIPSPSSYSKLDDQTLNEVAGLVLSQQYHGEDIFMLQKKSIHELYQRVDELTELADLKKRFKKTIKRYIPNIGISTIKKSKKAMMLLKNNPQVFKKVLFYLKRGEIRYLIQKISRLQRLCIFGSTF